MTLERRSPTVVAIDSRVRALEERAIADDGLHSNLMRADSQTAAAVEKLTAAINDPYAGLIVQLNSFRTEVINDRNQFRSWVRGATFVLGAIFTLVTVAAPWIQKAIESFTGARP